MSSDERRTVKCSLILSVLVPPPAPYGEQKLLSESKPLCSHFGPFQGHSLQLVLIDQNTVALRSLALNFPAVIIETMPRHGSKVATLSRNVIERNRRILTKDLLTKLASVINPDQPAPKWTSPQLLDQATAHVKQLQKRVEMLKQKKQLLESTTDETAGVGGSTSAVFTVTDLESRVEVCLSSRLNDRLILTRVIDVLEEEAAPVVAVSYSRVGDRINHIIHSQAVCPRIGIDSSRVHERLKMLTGYSP